MAIRNPIVLLAVAIVGLVCLVVASGSMFTVNEREFAVVVEFGKPVRAIDEPGLNFKVPFVQVVRRLPKTKQFWANTRGDLLVDLPTKDGKKIEVSVWAVWRITDPQQFVTILQSPENAEKQVRQRVRAAIRDAITSYDLSEVVRSTDRELTYSFGLDQLPSMSDDLNGEEATGRSRVGERPQVEFGRLELLRHILTRVQQELLWSDDPTEGGLNRGIEMVDVGVSSISFTESVRRAAFDRLKAFMDSIAAGHTNAGLELKQNILNQTKAEEERILGEGEEKSTRMRGEVEAEIIELYAKAIRETGDFYNFQRTLAVYEKVFDLDTRLILTTDSDLLRMLKEIPEYDAE